MPKRPSVIRVTPDDSTILCADKFGDVYSLPLIPLPEDDAQDGNAAKAAQQSPAPPQRNVIAANELTVHSARNRRALECQLKQVDTWVKTKEPVTFKHELLLGHVSMITNFAFVRIPAPAVDTDEAEKNFSRTYILTADRDEHIRVSRGPPQTHVIEGYCLGHAEFVSGLCVYDEDVLLSGGGDDEIFVWRWQECRLVKKIDLREAVDGFLNSSNGEGSGSSSPKANSDIAVKGIWKVYCGDEANKVNDTYRLAIDHSSVLNPCCTARNSRHV